MSEHDEPPMVYLVDDDLAVRRALSRLLRSAGFRTREFRSGDEFMSAGVAPGRACVVAESIMSDGAGMDIPGRLRESGLISRSFS